jgi:hypothetical protein
MEATRDLITKRRIIAISHFAMTMVSYLSLFSRSGIRFEKLLLVLQPQLYFFYRLDSTTFHLKNRDEIIFLFFIITAAAWSMCFGWLAAKFIGWLNHFPVLGKRVF